MRFCLVVARAVIAWDTLGRSPAKYNEVPHLIMFDQYGSRRILGS